jgi:hypothetical protein
LLTGEVGARNDGPESTGRSILVHVEQRDWLARVGKVALGSEASWLLVEQECVTMGPRVLSGSGASIWGDVSGRVGEYKFASINGNSVNQPVTGLSLREVATNWAWVNQCKGEG